MIRGDTRNATRERERFQRTRANHFPLPHSAPTVARRWSPQTSNNWRCTPRRTTRSCGPRRSAGRRSSLRKVEDKCFRREGKGLVITNQREHAFRYGRNGGFNREGSLSYGT